MYKSWTASRARGEPTTPKFRPLELSPDIVPMATRPEGWIQPAAEPRHRTKMPIKSALKKMGRQAPFPSRPYRDVDNDSGYGNGPLNDHKYNAFIVHPQLLGPPGVSGSPKQPARPLGEWDSNNPRSPGVQRPQPYLSDTTAPFVPPQPQAPAPPPVHPAGRSSKHDEIHRTDRESHYHKGKLSEKLPQNTSNAGPRYEPISSLTAQTPRHMDYGATLNPRHPVNRHGVPPSGYPIYAHPYPSHYPQQHYQAQYPYQGHPRRPNDVENYDIGLSDNEGRRSLLPRPHKYMPDGYSSETGAMHQYHISAYSAGRPAPPGRSERQFTAQPDQPSNEPIGWVRVADVLRMQGHDTKGHRRDWTEPSLLRGVALSWPILEYKQRRRDPNLNSKVFFDISQDPNGTDGRGIRLLRHGDYGMDKDFSDEAKNLPFSTAIKMRYIDMKCTAPELQPWNVIIERQEGDGIRVIDFFRAIYETYQKPLTRSELRKYHDLVNSEACQRAFKRRCRKAPGLTEYNESRGILRVDLVGDRTLYLRLHCDADTKRYEFDLIQQNQDNICASQLVPYHA